MKEKGQVVRTGFKAFDKMTGGLRGSDLICIASDPAVGKTALALNIAANVVFSKKAKPVLIFSLADDRHKIMQRLFASEAGVSLRDVKSGTFPRHKWVDLTNAGARLEKCPLYIVDTPCMSIKSLASESHILASSLRDKRQKLSLVIVDYLQVIRRVKTSRHKGGGAEKILADLKLLARDLEVPILVLSQASRIGGRHRGGHPGVLDLEDGAALGLHADLVVILHRKLNRSGGPGAVAKYVRGVRKSGKLVDGVSRDAREVLEGAEVAHREVTNPHQVDWGRGKKGAGERGDRAEIVVAKNSRGRTGRVPLEFFGNLVRFKNLAN